VTKIIVGIVDYQSGNIRSVTNAVEFAGGMAKAVKRHEDISECSHLLLPGVGAFGFCASQLRASGLLPALEQWALKDRKPLLGICVGMQLLADYSEEQGQHKGLGWLGGAVRKLCRAPGSSVRIPHVGWNEVQFLESFGDVRQGESPNFYFDHSYAYQDLRRGSEVGQCTHGRQFSAMIRRDNVVAVQFHPEKSQAAGMRVFRAFFAM
jgi:glutamine amidotransferase